MLTNLSVVKYIESYSSFFLCKIGERRTKNIEYGSQRSRFSILFVGKLIDRRSLLATELSSNRVSSNVSIPTSGWRERCQRDVPLSKSNRDVKKCDPRLNKNFSFICLEIISSDKSCALNRAAPFTRFFVIERLNNVGRIIEEYRSGYFILTIITDYREFFSNCTRLLKIKNN